MVASYATIALVTLLEAVTHTICCVASKVVSLFEGLKLSKNSVFTVLVSYQALIKKYFSQLYGLILVKLRNTLEVCLF